MTSSRYFFVPPSLLDTRSPFYGQHQGLAALDCVAENLRILVGNAFRAVDDVDDQIAAINGAERALHAKLLDAIIDACLATNAGGIDENTRFAHQFERRVQ